MCILTDKSDFTWFNHLIHMRKITCQREFTLTFRAYWHPDPIMGLTALSLNQVETSMQLKWSRARVTYSLGTGDLGWKVNCTREAMLGHRDCTAQWCYLRGWVASRRARQLLARPFWLWFWQNASAGRSRRGSKCLWLLLAPTATGAHLNLQLAECLKIFLGKMRPSLCPFPTSSRVTLQSGCSNVICDRRCLIGAPAKDVITCGGRSDVILHQDL